MSWVGGEFTFDFSTSRDEINREIIESLAADGASSQYRYTGTFRGIEFNSKTFFSSYNAAHDAVRRMQGDRDKNMAVPYYEFEETLRANKKLIALETKIKELEKKYREAERKNYLSTLTSEFVSCRTCKSKLNRSFLVDRASNLCPVCEKDLRPDSMNKHINDIFKRWRDTITAKDQLEKELTAKLMENPEKYAKKRWYVTASLYIG